MIDISNSEVTGWEAAIRGMRNPLNSWDRSDSDFVEHYCYRADGMCPGDSFKLGWNDIELMHKLTNAGTDHRKYMRMITVYADIIAPLYWWKEYDTYKVGTVANSCSTMHTIHKTGISEELFSLDGEYKLTKNQRNILDGYMMLLEDLRVSCKTGDDAWRMLIQLLPEGFNQKRTVMLNYEVLANIYKSRKTHKLDEWRNFCKWVEMLPYSELITGVR